MAAKPPKPPGNFLKSLLNQHNNNNNINNKNQQQQLQQQHNNEVDDIKSNISRQDCNTATPAIPATKRTNCNCSNISIMHLFHEMKQEFPTIPDTIVAQCVNENCHQRENCIQMLRNELELNPIPAQSYPAKVLHPPNNNNIQQHTTNHNNTTTIQKPPLQQKPVVVQQKPPLKPIRPIRTAPLQPPPPPPSAQQSNNNNNNNSTKTNSTFAKNTTTTNKQLAGGEYIANNEGVSDGSGGGLWGQIETSDVPTKITPHYKQSISTATTTTSTANSTTAEVNNHDNDNVCVGETVERNLPRQRPTTLNLNTQLQKQQQQQRQRLNVQLQQRFQEQRNRLQQQQPQNQPTIVTKPLRKAPLPPIAPKPSHYQLNNHTNTTNAAVNNNSFLNDSLSSPNHSTTTTTSPLSSESEISVSVSLSTPSTPTSPNTTTHYQNHHLQTKSPIRHRSVITLQPEPPYTRDFLFTPVSVSSSTPSSPSLAATSSAATTTTIQTTANSSSSANSSPTVSVAGSQKSYTSVNLTLRPPVSPTGASPALQPSTIDITAGPGFSGASGGGNRLHYSSTSYDARLGYQQNFQITVTDEGGVFSACRLRPQQQRQQQRCLNQVNISKENQYLENLVNESNHNNYINPFLNAEPQQQQQLQLQQQQQFHNNNVVALQQNIQNSIQSPHGVGTINTLSSFGGSVGISGNMCSPPQQAVDAPTQEILQRQKKKRDKLAAALREYKKRLGNVEQEINILTGTMPTKGLSERLDEEIIKLRRDCQDMLRSSNPLTQAPPPQQELAINHQPQQQPFPGQRVTRSAPRPPPPRQTSLDIIQHQSQSSTPHTPPAASLPNLMLYNSPQQQQLNHTNSAGTSPSYYHHQSAPLITNNINNTTMFTDSYYADSEPLVNDDDGEYEEIVEPHWECNMCTFRNHPQLNICETCDNVRPGMLTNLSRALSATNCTTNTADAQAGAAASPFPSASSNLSLLGGVGNGGSNISLNNGNSRNGLNTANGNLEHDLVQQQLQHFALHT